MPPASREVICEQIFITYLSPVIEDNPQEKIFTVSQLTREIKEVLEGEFTSIWVEGEISNFLHHTSGHRYFTLKDADAQLKAVIWKFSAQGLTLTLKDGLKVRAFGDITLYEKGGTYQLRVIKIMAKGIGSLEEQFQKLKAKLAAEGLFEPERKRPIPQYPRAIGIITSPTGAAIRDIINIARRRAPMVRLVLRPTKVQGDGAAADIAAAIKEFNDWGEVDTLIVGRGGGSLEDLWAFNEEVVARAIFESEIPVVSAVGHEIDFSISDFVADLRAATPSAAAELATYDSSALVQFVINSNDRLQRALLRNIELRRERLNRIRQSRVMLRPAVIVEPFAQRLDDDVTRMQNSLEMTLLRRRSRFETLHHKLEALSPDGVLKRGYAVVRRSSDKVIIKKAAELAAKDNVEISFGDGSRSATID